MASINVRKETGKLVIDFRFKGERCREQTALDDTPANRKRLVKFVEKIESDITAGTFNYAETFPNSKRAGKLGLTAVTPVAAALGQIHSGNPGAAPRPAFATPAAVLPTFREFTATWVAENDVGWRRSHKRTVMDIIKVHLEPAFGEKVVSDITKADILQFRSALAKVPGRNKGNLSAKRINAITGVLRQILNEAADRFEFTTAYRNIKPLKVPRSDIVPFNLEEVQAILATVRADFKDYYTVRFFTGMRTGEIDGLKWKYVDFERRQILVRETIVGGEEDITKTDGSQREIQMSEIVYQALRRQEKATRSLSVFVFCNLQGQPLDHVNVTKRVWYPLLRHMGLALRRPYQTRHTAATLWLGAGENPQWIARQMGHASTEMLFKVYARFVPNLTRQDGSAFERLLVQSGTVAPVLPAVPGLAPASSPPVSPATPSDPSSESNSSAKESSHV